MADFEKTIPAAEIPPGESRPVIVDETPVLLVNAGGSIYAIEDACTHDGESFDNGPIADCEVTCPRHGARFDVRTGKVLSMPASEDVATFAVKIEDGFVMVNPEPGTTGAAAVSGPTSANTMRSPAPAQDDSEPAEVGTQANSEESDLLTALKEVIDPELGINIVDLGLIYEVDLEGDQANVQMTLTSPACPAGPQIISQAQAALERLRIVNRAEIQLVMTPPWSPERMTDDARDQLGIF